MPIYVIRKANTMELDFLDCLQKYLNSQDLNYKFKQGDLEEGIIIIYNTSGEQKVREYYNGVFDKRKKYEFALKSKNSWGNYNILTKLASRIEQIQDIPSINGSYDFHEIRVFDIPTPIILDGEYYIYTLKFEVLLTTYEK
jgi:hypothetical protein